MEQLSSQTKEKTMRRENGSLVINISKKDLPRNDSGDVEFANIDEVFEHFDNEEVKVLVERAVYHMEYQRTHHKKYSALLREKEKPVKEAAKRLFPGIAYINLTNEQYQEALEEAYPSV
jgi:hypothetical protein